MIPKRLRYRQLCLNRYEIVGIQIGLKNCIKACFMLLHEIHMMKQILVSGLIAIAFTGCVSKPSAKIEQLEVKTTLVRIDDTERKEAVPAIIVAAVGTEIGKAAAKALVKLGAAALENYAEKYEAAYSAKLVANDFDLPADAAPQTIMVEGQKVELPVQAFDTAKRLRVRQRYQFERGIIFRGKPSAEVLAKHLNTSPDLISAHLKHDEKGNTYVPTMTLEFAVVHGGKEAGSMRIIPEKISFNAPAAKRLKVPFTEKDELKSTISIVFREAYSNADGKASINEVKAATFTASLADFDKVSTGLVRYHSDWSPAIRSRAYSVEVTVLETSDAKKWIMKAAEKLRESGEKKINELAESKPDEA